MFDADGALRGVGARARDSAHTVAANGWSDVQSVLGYQLIRVSGMTITVGGLLAAVLAMLATWALTIVVRRALARYAERHPQANRASLYTVTRLAQYAVLAAGLMLALGLAGIPVGKFAVFAGALGVGLGFGLQAIFSNFISGLILLFDKSLRVGDFVELESGVHGEVRDIKIRATTIVTNDNIDILVPNSEFVVGRVVSWTHREVSRRLRVPFGVAYGTDKDLVKRAALEAAREVPFTLSQDGPRRPQVWLASFGASSLDFELVVWLTAEATKRPSAVKAAYNWALHSALQKYAIELPFPQQDLHVRSLFGLQGEAALRALRIEAPAAMPEGFAQADAARNDAIDDVRRSTDDSDTMTPEIGSGSGKSSSDKSGSDNGEH
ncbi:MAG: mechanosensitive ion channel domain-containing protein [Luteimonas sp.]